MPAFPSAINWAWGSSFKEDFGQNPVTMESGEIYTQTFYGVANITEWTIKHIDLTPAELIEVRDFLKTNASLVITITDPLSSKSYDGRLTSALSINPKRGNRYDATWQFKGEEL